MGGEKRLSGVQTRALVRGSASLLHHQCTFHSNYLIHLHGLAGSRCCTNSRELGSTSTGEPGAERRSDIITLPYVDSSALSLSAYGGIRASLHKFLYTGAKRRGNGPTPAVPLTKLGMRQESGSCVPGQPTAFYLQWISISLLKLRTFTSNPSTYPS